MRSAATVDALELVVLLGDHADRVEEAVDVEREGDEQAEGQVAVDHHGAAEEEHEDERHGGGELDDGLGGGADAAGAEVGFEVGDVGLVELAGVHCLRGPGSG